jgi:hypothetical protein
MSGIILIADAIIKANLTAFRSYTIISQAHELRGGCARRRGVDVLEGGVLPSTRPQLSESFAYTHTLRQREGSLACSRINAPGEYLHCVVKLYNKK